MATERSDTERLDWLQDWMLGGWRVGIGIGGQYMIIAATGVVAASASTLREVIDIVDGVADKAINSGDSQ